MIETSYDLESDTLFVRFGVGWAIPASMKDVAPGVRVDFDATGNPIGVEVRNVHGRLQGQGTVYAHATRPTEADRRHPGSLRPVHARIDPERLIWINAQS